MSAPVSASDGSIDQRVRPAKALVGALTIPGDKSVSHRALLLGALARGTTRIDRLAPGEDVRSTAKCLRQLGVAITIDDDEACATVVSGGPASLCAPGAPLDCGNSGTTMRLLAGLLAGAGIGATLTGDASLRRRPMGRVADPLASMGITVETTETAAGAGRPPITVRAGIPTPGAWTSRVASAQVKSCVLLCGLGADGQTTVTEPWRSRDHTERMLRVFGVDVIESGLTVQLPGPCELEAASLIVPGDLSSAAFFLAAAAARAGSRIVLRDVGVNPTRTGFLDALARMGCAVTRGGEELWGFEPVADLIVRSSGALQAIEVSGGEVPRLIDELPVLAVLATQAQGRTVVRDARELRVKETDRIATTAAMIRALGGSIEEREDGFVIDGPQRLAGGEIEAGGDHRLAMAGAVAALVCSGETVIHGAEAAGVSYPRFFEDMDVLAQR